jgi:hypothetical protein
MNLDLVDQPGRNVLLAYARTAHHADVLVSGGGSRLLQGALDAVGHKCVHPSLGALRGRLVGDYEKGPPSGPVGPFAPHHGKEAS